MFTSLRLLACIAGLAGAGALAGCGAAGLYPNDAAATSTATGEDVQGGSIQGSNFGGHAPIVGAHVYLVQPGTAGYGSVEKGLLSATYNTNTSQTAGELFPTTKNGSWPTATSGGNATDQFVPSVDSAGNPFYAVTTDSGGNFNVTGDYACTVGQPVFLIAYGGSTSFVGQGSGSAASTQTNTFPISSIQVSNLAGQGSGTGTATYTFNIGGTTPELFYVGEQVVLSNTSLATGTGGAAYAGLFNGGTFTVSQTNLSTTSFQITFNGDYGGYSAANQAVFPAQTTTQTGATVTANPPFNPAIVNMAMLGICPSSGNFSTGATKLPFVYMNEVSTAALAFAMNQYMNWSATDQGGNDEFHIGAPSTAQAQQGIVNAAINAGNLYDITGSNQSTVFAGEGHIARAQTASGAGIVPQAELDTLGNILAACVDSPNTYRLGTGTVSNQCNTLETYATDNGVYDSSVSVSTGTFTHVSFNTAQAAFNIAHYPAGNGTGSTSGTTQTVTAGTTASAANFATALFNLPTGNVPFVPQLASAPNDFSVGINWQTSPYAQSGTLTGSTTNQSSVGEVAIDSLGNAWIVGNGSGLGSPATNANGIFRLTPSGAYSYFQSTLFTAVGTTPIAGIAIDTSNNLFVSSTAGVQERFASTSYATAGGGATNSNIIGYVDGSAYATNVTANAGELAVDSAVSPSIYVANLEQNNPPASGTGGVGTDLVKEPAAVGNATATFSLGASGGAVNTVGGCASYMGYLTLDGSNNIWVSNQAFPFVQSEVCKFSNTGTLLYSYTAGASAFFHMIAVDAGGNAWWADKQSNSLYKGLASATSASGVNGVATAYAPTTGVLSAPRGIAVDGTNTVWVTNGATGGISRFSDSGVQMSPTYYVGGGFNTVTGGGTPTANFITFDQAGNAWVADTGHGEVIEWIGIASPTVQPLAQQRYGTANSNGHGTGQLP